MIYHVPCSCIFRMDPDVCFTFYEWMNDTIYLYLVIKRQNSYHFRFSSNLIMVFVLGSRSFFFVSVSVSTSAAFSFFFIFYRMFGFRTWGFSESGVPAGPMVISRKIFFAMLSLPCFNFLFLIFWWSNCFSLLK